MNCIETLGVRENFGRRYAVNFTPLSFKAALVKGYKELRVRKLKIGCSGQCSQGVLHTPFKISLLCHKVTVRLCLFSAHSYKTYIDQLCNKSSQISHTTVLKCTQTGCKEVRLVQFAFRR